jgi:hypothetical protein
MKNDFVPYEESEQISLVEELAFWRNQHKDLLFYAVPNGEWRHKATAGKLKAMGVMRGVPDLCFPMAKGGYFGLYIEMKRVKGGAVREDQKDWIEKLRGAGYKVEVCRGAAEAKKTIQEYLDLPPTKVK